YFCISNTLTAAVPGEAIIILTNSGVNILIYTAASLQSVPKNNVTMYSLNKNRNSEATTESINNPKNNFKYHFSIGLLSFFFSAISPKITLLSEFDINVTGCPIT